MATPRKQQDPRAHEGQVERTEKQDAHSHKSPAQKEGGLTRGKDKIAEDMSTGHSQTRGRDQTAREMGERNRDK